MSAMAKYKIGVTEAGDAGIDLSWEDKLDTVDGAILITKNITSGFRNAVEQNQDKVIVHATCTGYGGTVVEPHVPTYERQLMSALALVKDGMQVERVVIRVDPIIPTQKGIIRACSVVKTAISLGFCRFRISVLDMYPHVRKRFAEAGLSDPYNGRFSATSEMFHDVDVMVRACRLFWLGTHGKLDGLRIESCAEPTLNADKGVGVVQCGCVSAYDLALLGLEADESDQGGYQRKNCMCYSGKVELLKHKQRCPHGCLYCYWRGDSEWEAIGKNW